MYRDASATILLIDDDRAVRSTLSIVLEGEGHEVVAFATCGAALAALEGGHGPDLCLVDYRMPDVDGIEAARLLRQQFPGLPVLLLTGASADLDEIEDARSEGTLLEVLQKPLGPRDLEAAVQRVLAWRATGS